MKYFRYRSTNCFLVESSNDQRLLAIDAGWPCSLYEYGRALKSTGHHFNQIAWAVVTHFHMDHAGLIGEFIEKGIHCFIFENQEEAIDPMERMILKTYKKYKNIDKERLIKVRADDSRAYFEKIGIHGEVLITPGHSPGSITFISDDHEAVIGDLYPIGLVMPDDAASLKSRELIKAKKVENVYPSHAPFFKL